MDLKRFAEISGHEALKLLSENRKVFPGEGSESSYYILNNKGLVFHDRNGSEYTSNFSIGDFVKKDWYAKMPFNVRLEMLARPDEWVGAFRDHSGHWHKVGFETEKMKAKETSIRSERKPCEVSLECSLSELERCIPIEDVPKGEL